MINQTNTDNQIEETLLGRTLPNALAKLSAIGVAPRVEYALPRVRDGLVLKEEPKSAAWRVVRATDGGRSLLTAAYPSSVIEELI